MSIAFTDWKHPYIDLGQNYKVSFDYKLKIEDEKVLAKAKEDLRETPEVREEALRELRELIKSLYLSIYISMKFNLEAKQIFFLIR